MSSRARGATEKSGRNTRRAGRKSGPPAETKGRVEKKRPGGRRKGPAKPRKHVAPEEEQDILTRFSKGETLRKVENGYPREIRGEIRNLRKAFEAGEFVSKGGVWQLVS